MRLDIGEVITAMATPFQENLEVDYEGVERLANYLADNGTEAILVAGTTGESPTLTHEEEIEVLKTVKKAVGDRIKIVMGAGSNCTRTAIEMSRMAENIGVDAILSIVPYYNKPSQKGILEHFSRIADAVDTPIIFYNIPGRTGKNMEAETMAELAENHEHCGSEAKQS